MLNLWFIKSSHSRFSISVARFNFNQFLFIRSFLIQTIVFTKKLSLLNWNTNPHVILKISSKVRKIKKYYESINWNHYIIPFVWLKKLCVIFLFKKMRRNLSCAYTRYMFVFDCGNFVVGNYRQHWYRNIRTWICIEYNIVLFLWRTLYDDKHTYIYSCIYI